MLSTRNRWQHGAFSARSVTDPANLPKVFTKLFSLGREPKPLLVSSSRGVTSTVIVTVSPATKSKCICTSHGSPAKRISGGRFGSEVQSFRPSANSISPRTVALRHLGLVTISAYCTTPVTTWRPAFQLGVSCTPEFSIVVAVKVRETLLRSSKSFNNSALNSAVCKPPMHRLELWQRYGFQFAQRSWPAQQTVT